MQFQQMIVLFHLMNREDGPMKAKLMKDLQEYNEDNVVFSFNRQV